MLGILDTDCHDDMFEAWKGKYCNQGYSDSDDDLSCHDKYIVKLSDVRRMSEIDVVSGAAKMKAWRV